MKIERLEHRLAKGWKYEQRYTLSVEPPYILDCSPTPDLPSGLSKNNRSLKYQLHQAIKIALIW